MKCRLSMIAAIVILLVQVTFGQANRKLQIHLMDVGQGNSAVLISPKRDVVVFDDGVLKNCDKPVSYLQQLGITKIDYHIASHYHSDPIGCAAEVSQEVALPETVIDRGQTYASSVYRNYVTLAGSHHKTAAPGMKIALDAGSTTPSGVPIPAWRELGKESTRMLAPFSVTLDLPKAREKT